MVVKENRIPKSTSAPSELYTSVIQEVQNLIVGQTEIINFTFLTLLAGGHVLLEGVPGLAKTLLVRTIAKVLGLDFQRIQFTPDLLPSDITGTDIFEGAGKSKEAFRFIQGPIFTQILLADEINRTPPKTQSALLQAMQEKQVTVLGHTYNLPQPFFVMATQNPIEQEGTYPLPEAQLDRFMTHLVLEYPSASEELQILDIIPDDVQKIHPILDVSSLTELQESVKNMPAGEKIKQYVVDLVRQTRPKQSKLESIQTYVEWGAGPRASQLLLRLSKSHAVSLGKPVVDKEDVDTALIPALRHRLVLNYRALSEKMTREELLRQIQREVSRA